MEGKLKSELEGHNGDNAPAEDKREDDAAVEDRRQINTASGPLKEANPAVQPEDDAAQQKDQLDQIVAGDNQAI